MSPPLPALPRPRRTRAALAGLSLAAAALVASGCASGPRLFSRTAVAWEDDDRQAFAPQPAARFAPPLWDAIDNMVMRPAARFFAFETSGEAFNVNALDEVPDSSWYENRISREPMEPAEVAAGACDRDDLQPRAPWSVVSGKVDGAGAGFVFEDASGRRFVLKADRPSQPEQTTAADAIGASIYHAAGYHVPCNRVVLFEADWVQLADDAVMSPTGGEERPMTEDDLEEVFESLRGASGGRLRGLASRYLDGEPLGPWAYRNVWDPDLNDAIPHQGRRELRGMRVLNAWLDHWDARQLNTLATWISVGPDGAGYVRHNLIDFGDILGFVQGSPRAQTRYGHSQWLDPQHIVEDAFTFGIPTRPWDVAQQGETWPILGYYGVEQFDPAEWRPNYWNGAFEQLTERDAAWMARIIARFEREHLRAAVEVGRFSEPRVEERLLEVMLGRRQRVLARYLDLLSPLADPTLEEGRLCLVDLAVRSGLRAEEARRYRGALRRPGEVGEPRTITRTGDELCVEVPPDDDYRILRVHAESPGVRASHPMDLHLADGRIVGLERLTSGGGAL